jgi:hypothetical protein
MSNSKHMPVLALVFLAGVSSAATIRVPQDRATIQTAIAAAQAGDVVLVSPGVYDENIDFLGKAITVQSAKGPKQTIIDGGLRDSVVIFRNGEGRQSVLKGFTLRKGNAAQFPSNGGGVNIVFASPTIEGNWITENSACDGNGVGLYFSGALVANNRIFNNFPRSCSGATSGGGIYIGGTGGAEVFNNLIADNRIGMSGGGIGMNATGAIRVERNIVRGNQSTMQGGGVAMINASEPTFVNNLVTSNSAPEGGGLYLFVPWGSPAGTWVNNTVSDNRADLNGSQLQTGGFVDQLKFVNNIFSTSGRTAAMHCSTTYSAAPPQFFTNDVYVTAGSLATGSCAGLLGDGGNVSIAPLFVGGGTDADAYRLSANSPLIDIGGRVQDVGKRDLFGNPRRVDGNADGRSVIDLGAHEFIAP